MAPDKQARPIWNLVSILSIYSNTKFDNLRFRIRTGGFVNRSFAVRCSRRGVLPITEPFPRCPAHHDVICAVSCLSLSNFSGVLHTSKPCISALSCPPWNLRGQVIFTLFSPQRTLTPRCPLLLFIHLVLKVWLNQSPAHCGVVTVDLTASWGGVLSHHQMGFNC